MHDKSSNFSGKLCMLHFLPQNCTRMSEKFDRKESTKKAFSSIVHFQKKIQALLHDTHWSFIRSCICEKCCFLRNYKKTFHLPSDVINHLSDFNED